MSTFAKVIIKHQRLSFLRRTQCKHKNDMFSEFQPHAATRRNACYNCSSAVLKLKGDKPSSPNKVKIVLFLLQLRHRNRRG